MSFITQCLRIMESQVSKKRASLFLKLCYLNDLLVQEGSRDFLRKQAQSVSGVDIVVNLEDKLQLLCFLGVERIQLL